MNQRNVGLFSLSVNASFVPTLISPHFQASGARSSLTRADLLAIIDEALAISADFEKAFHGDQNKDGEDKDSY